MNCWTKRILPFLLSAALIMQAIVIFPAVEAEEMTPVEASSSEESEETPKLEESPEESKESVKAPKPSEEQPSTVVYLDGENGSDTKSGKSKEEAVQTFKKALELMEEDGKIIVSSFQENHDIVFNKKGTLELANDITLIGANNHGIKLSNGAKLKAGSHTLNMSGFSLAIDVAADSTIQDGHYVLDHNGIAFYLHDNAQIAGTGRQNLTISALKNTANGFHFSSDAWFRNCTVTVEAYKEKGEIYAGLNMQNASLTTRGIWYYFDPVEDKKSGIKKGGIHLDHSDFYVYKATGSNKFTNAFALLGPSYLKNGSTVTADGSRITVSEAFTVEDSKVVIKNSKQGGLNVDYKGADVVFRNSILETSGLKSLPSFGVGARSGPCSLTFEGNSVVNTEAKDSRVDDGGVYRSNQGSYVVTGGSFLLAHDPKDRPDITTPTNGKANGDEKLTLFTLADSGMMTLQPINKLGNTYSYPVANASADGKKHVWVPAAVATFTLNNADATFADKTEEPKIAQTIRGYFLNDVTGNTNPGTPSDKNGVKFLGWYYKDSKGQEKPFIWTEKLTEDRNVYAKWESKQVIYHNGQQGQYLDRLDNDAKTAKVLSFDEVLKKQSAFDLKGKVFQSWNTAPDGSGKTIQPGATLSFEKDDTQIDLYAQYQTIGYTVAFSANGGTFSADSLYKQRTDVFTIQEGANGGEVAILNAQAHYGEKLSDVLKQFNGINGNSLMPDPNAKKLGYVFGNTPGTASYWLKTPTAQGGTVHFASTSFFGLAFPGDDPVITANTTYYMNWKPDPKVTVIEDKNMALWGDIWTSFNGQNSTAPKVIYKGQVSNEKENFDVYAHVEISSIAEKMQAIEEQFNNPEDLTAIKLSAPTSVFTATLTVPEGIDLSKATAEAVGLGNCFDLGTPSVQGQKITVSFTLKPGITNYKELKDAVASAGIAQEEPQARSMVRMASPQKQKTPKKYITLTLKNVALDHGTLEKSSDNTLQIKGTLNGTFQAVAQKGSTLEIFDFSWTGRQESSGKDALAQNDTDILYSLLLQTPTALTLPGDLEVKGENDQDFNTEHQTVYLCTRDDTLTFRGNLDVSSIQEQMDVLKESYAGATDTIQTQNVASQFVATLELPKGLKAPSTSDQEKIQLVQGNTELFKIKEKKVDGAKIIITMELNKKYEKFDDLYKDVKAVNKTLQVLVPGITLKADATGQQTVIGTVSGDFCGEAFKPDGTMKPFYFQWKAEQNDDGRDAVLATKTTLTPEESKSIQLTLQAPVASTLYGDILIGNDTESKAYHKVSAGEELTYTGRLTVKPIKDLIQQLKEAYKGDSNSITTTDIASSFTARLTFPKGLEIPQDLSGVTLTDNTLFQIKSGDVKREDNTIVVTMTLKKNYTTFSELFKDVTDVSDTLDVTVPGIVVDANAKPNTIYTVIGAVEGFFTGKAMSSSGTTQIYNFAWTAEQDPDGVDYLLTNKDKEEQKAISYTIIVRDTTSSTSTSSSSENKQSSESTQSSDSSQSSENSQTIDKSSDAVSVPTDSQSVPEEKPEPNPSSNTTSDTTTEEGAPTRPTVKRTDSNAPKTGELLNLVFYAGMGIFACAGAYLIKNNKRRKK